MCGVCVCHLSSFPWFSGGNVHKSLALQLENGKNPAQQVQVHCGLAVRPKKQKNIFSLTHPKLWRVSNVILAKIKTSFEKQLTTTKVYLLQKRASLNRFFFQRGDFYLLRSSEGGNFWVLQFRFVQLNEHDLDDYL